MKVSSLLFRSGVNERLTMIKKSRRQPTSKFTPIVKVCKAELILNS